MLSCVGLHGMICVHDVIYLLWMFIQFRLSHKLCTYLLPCLIALCQTGGSKTDFKQLHPKSTEQKGPNQCMEITSCIGERSACVSVFIPSYWVISVCCPFVNSINSPSQHLRFLFRAKKGQETRRIISILGGIQKPNCWNVIDNMKEQSNQWLHLGVWNSQQVTIEAFMKCSNKFITKSIHASNVYDYFILLFIEYFWSLSHFFSNLKLNYIVYCM